VWLARTNLLLLPPISPRGLSVGPGRQVRQTINSPASLNSRTLGAQIVPRLESGQQSRREAPDGGDSSGELGAAKLAKGKLDPVWPSCLSLSARLSALKAHEDAEY